MPRTIAWRAARWRTSPRPASGVGGRAAARHRRQTPGAALARLWTTSAHLTELPEDLKADLGKADLILLKGDVNYRRLLEDRDWPPTTDLAAVTTYMPAPL